MSEFRDVSSFRRERFHPKVPRPRISIKNRKFRVFFEAWIKYYRHYLIEMALIGGRGRAVGEEKVWAFVRATT
jgi:hypothetical protein